MAKPPPSTHGSLLDRIRDLESQLLSQEDIQSLIHELQVHQEEVRVQNAALFETQRELETSRDRYAELYDFAPIALASLDSNGILLSVNLAAARLLGIERQRAIGMPILLYVAEHDRRRLLDHLGRCRREDTSPCGIELELFRAQSDGVPVELVCKRFHLESGREPVYYVALSDLRERRRAEADKLRAMFEREKLSSQEQAARLASDTKDRFLAVLSHELRTPLTPILLTLERLEVEFPERGSLRTALDTIRRNLSVETRLIDDLLDVTRIERDRLSVADEAVDLHAALRHAVEMCADDFDHRGIRLDVELRAVSCWVRGDGTRLRQVFWNLLTNAQRFTAPGGSVRVQTYDRDGRVCVDVIDTGPGVAPEDLERVFEPFEQADRGSRDVGLGLGLAICRGLVRAHGGTIRAASVGKGLGTTFTVELPTCATPALSQAVPELHARGAGRRILLVEDNEDTAFALAILLRSHGYEVQLAHTIDAARAALRSRFDVLLSDLQLPDGSGLELARELVGDGGHRTAAIAMSGYGAERDVRESRDAGFSHHLVKPIAIERVLEVIEAVTLPAPDEPRH